MTTLDSDFEDALREDLLDEAEDAIGDAAEQLKADADAEFQSYAARNGYDIDHLWEDSEVGAVRRDRNAVRASVSWPALTGLFEYGVGPHVIEGNPTLAFGWESPPGGTRPRGAPSFVQTDSVNWGSVTGGIPEARAIRTALDLARLYLGGTVTR